MSNYPDNFNAAASGLFPTVAQLATERERDAALHNALMDKSVVDAVKSAMREIILRTEKCARFNYEPEHSYAGQPDRKQGRANDLECLLDHVDEFFWNSERYNILRDAGRV